MRLLPKHLWLLFAVATTVLALSGSAWAIGSTDPALCLDGGWQTLQKDDGGHFKSERACVRYAEHGGILFRPNLTIVPFCFGGDVVASELGVFASGFPAGSVLTLTIEGAVWTATGSHVLTATTQGPHNRDPGELIRQPGISPTGHVVSVTARSAEGITARASQPVACV